MLSQCRSTVRRLMPKRVATCLLCSPWASNSRTVRSRSVSWGARDGMLLPPASSDRADCVDELAAWGGLAQVARRAGLQRAAHVLVVVVGRDHEHPGSRVVAVDPAGGLDAVHARQPDVHQDYRGVELVDENERQFCRLGLADQLNIGVLAEDLPDPVPVQGVVVHHQHPDNVGVHGRNVTWQRCPRGRRKVPIPKYVSPYVALAAITLSPPVLTA